MNTKQIRQTILDLAIRGELVPQDPTDEPASVLLERIRAEKEQLIKDKKLKRDKKNNEPIDEVPFELPEGWEWCRLGEVCEINPKNKLDDELEVSFIPMPLISDGFSNTHSFEIKKWNDIKKGYTHFRNGDIGVAKITPCFENRKSVIFNNLKNGVGAGTTELYILRSNLALNKYLFWFVKTQDFINKGTESFTGAVGQQRVSKDFIENTLIPLPPLAEQHRIAQKVEQLLAIVDTIEQLQEQLKSDVKQARNQVLNYAIAGKLTHQDPNDEPAEELLKRIGKTTATDTPYEKLPKGWAWCRLGDITKTIATKPYQILQSEIEKNGDFPVISQSANYIEGFSSDETKVLKVEDFIIVFGDHTRVVKYIDFDFIVGADGVKVILPNNNLSKYLYYLILNASYKIENRGYSRHFQFLQKEFFPLPPIAEQHRIVKKIETYFSFLDTIESNL